MFCYTSQQYCSLNLKKGNLLKIITLNLRVEKETTTLNLTFDISIVREILFLSRKSQGILKRDAGGNHVYMHFTCKVLMK